MTTFIVGAVFGAIALKFIESLIMRQEVARSEELAKIVWGK